MGGWARQKGAAGLVPAPGGFPKRRHATPSEPVTWLRIGVPSRECRGCGRKLTLADVRHFGTDIEGVRFVECKGCFGGLRKP